MKEIKKLKEEKEEKEIKKVKKIKNEDKNKKENKKEKEKKVKDKKLETNKKELSKVKKDDKSNKNYKENIVDKKIKEKKKRKVISKQTYILSLIITVSFCLSLILFINLIVREDTLTNIDFTHSRLYKLSKQSKEIIKNVNEPIVITIDKSLNYVQLTEILNNIIKLNDNISIAYSDSSELEGDTSGYKATIFVQAPKREKDIAVSFFNINFDSTILKIDTYKQYSILEEKLVNAIVSVINSETEDNASVAFLTGIDGIKLSEEMINLYAELRSFGILPITLNLEKENIPESIKIIAIIGPTKDITKAEYNKLLDFQAKGGDFVVAITPKYDTSTPLLNKFLLSYGVSVPVGNMLDYTDGNRHVIMQDSEVVMYYNNILLPNVTDNNEMTKRMIVEGTKPFFAFPTKLDFEKPEKLEKKNLKITNHVLSSELGVFKLDDIKDDDILDEKIPEDYVSDTYVLGSIIEKELSENSSSTMVIYPNYFFMTDLMIKGLIEDEMILIEDNLTLAKNSFTYLHPLKEKMIDLKKPLVISTYKYNKNTYKTHKVLTYIIYLLPTLIIVILGSITIFKRGYLARFGFVYKKKEKDRDKNKKKNKRIKE